MPALQIKDCPEEVYEQLRDCARKENRSISQQALTIIETYLNLYRSSDCLSDHAFTQPITDHERQDGFSTLNRTSQKSYLTERKKVFENLEKLRPLCNAPDSAELLAQIREEEAR